MRRRRWRRSCQFLLPVDRRGDRHWNLYVFRLGLKDIPELGRATQGVRIMRLNDGDSVASLALVDKIEDVEEETEEGEKPAPEEPKPKAKDAKA